jgi:hypothetical protein
MAKILLSEIGAKKSLFPQYPDIPGPSRQSDR